MSRFKFKGTISPSLHTRKVEVEQSLKVDETFSNPVETFHPRIFPQPDIRNERKKKRRGLVQPRKQPSILISATTSFHICTSTEAAALPFREVMNINS